MNHKLFVMICFLIGCFVLPLSFVSAQDAVDVGASDYLFFFGGRGGYSGSTEGIRALATIPNGDLLVADNYNNISEFNEYGEIVTVHKADAAGTSFAGVQSLATDTAGNIYMGIVNPNSIRVYAPDWTLTTTYGADVVTFSPQLLSYDNGHHILYAMLNDGNGAHLVGLDTDGKMLTDFLLPVAEGNNTTLYGGFAVNPDGNIVEGRGGISRQTQNLDAIEGAIDTFTPDGSQLSEWALGFTPDHEQTTAGFEDFHFFPVPYGLTVDSAGRVYEYEVTQLPPLQFGNPARITGLVVIYAPNGTRLREFPVSQSDSPVAAHIAFSPDEKLLYVSSANFVHIVSLTTDPPYTTVQMTTGGRVRADSNSHGTVLGALKEGDIVIVTGQNDAGDWLQVRYKGAVGWVSKSLTGPVAR